MEGGAASLHKLSKPVIQWQPRKKHKTVGDTRKPEVAAATALKEWSDYWKLADEHARSSAEGLASWQANRRARERAEAAEAGGWASELQQ